MEYAIEILLPIIGGLFLGNWLTERFGLSPIWTVILPILGMVLGILMLYKRFTLSSRKKGAFKNQEKQSPEGSTDSDLVRLPVDSLDFLYQKPPEESQKEAKGYADEDDEAEEFFPDGRNRP